MTATSQDAVISRSQPSSSASPAFEKGQRLVCASCQSEIEILNPCTCRPPAQELLCCGQPMMPSTGVAVNLNVDG